MLGLVVGVGMYTAWLYKVPSSLNLVSVFETFQTEAVPSTEFAYTRTLPSAEEPHQTMQLTTIMEQPTFTDESQTRSLGAVGGGVFLLPSQGAASTTEDIAALFSDPVVVDFTGEQSGVVFFAGENGEVREYPFISVPVADTTVSNATTP